MRRGPLAALLPLLLLHLTEIVETEVVFTAEPCDRDSFGLRPIQGDASRYKQCGPSSKVWIVPCAPSMSFDPVERVCKETEEPQLHRRLEKGRSKRPVITTPKPAPEEFVFSTVRPKRPKKGKKKTTTPRPMTTQNFVTEIFPEEPIRPAQPQPVFPKPGAFAATTIRPEYTVKYNGENMTEEELLRRLVDLVKAQKATAAKEKSEKTERERLEVERRIAEEQRLAREREEAEERTRLEEERRQAERLEKKRKDEEKKKKWEEAQRKKEEERRLAVERAEAARKKMEEEERRRRMEEEERRRVVEEEERRRKKMEEEERRLKLEEKERVRREEEDRLRREQEEQLAVERAEIERIEEQRRAAAVKAEQERLEQMKRIEEAKREQERLERLRKEEKEKREKEKEELMRRERERAERIRQEMERQLEEERLDRERQLMFNRHATTTASPDFEIIRFPPTPRHGSIVPPLPQTTTTTVSPWITSPNSWKPSVDVFSSFERADRMKTTAAPRLLDGCIPNGDCPFSYDGDHFCAHPDNPSLYLQCAPMIGRRGRWTTRRCPEGLLFSTHLGQCEKDPYSAYNPNQRVVIPRLPEETQTVSWQGNREIITVTPVYPRGNGIHNAIDTFPKDLLPVIKPLHPVDLFKPRPAYNEFDDYEELDLSKIHPLFPRVQPSFINNFLPFQPFQEGEKEKDEDNIIGAVFKPFLKKVALKQTKHFLDRVLSDDEIEKIEQEAKDRLRGEGTLRN